MMSIKTSEASGGKTPASSKGLLIAAEARAACDNAIREQREAGELSAMSINHDGASTAHAAAVDEVADARRAGIDLDLADSLLALPVGERWRRHDAALTLALKLRNAMKARNAGLQRTAQETR